MDLEYDRKFEEMKKYIPFLESMITRLESNSLASNPRQAQLDKIRSLRDLLLDKKKRMKMENLLKCEQVLVNLYAKVEQRDSLSGVKVKEDSVFSIDSPTPKEKSELEAVRNKLKTVAKIQEATQDTLPEIARASEVQEVCTSGKEPALFQRRPNKSSLSPINYSPNKNVEEITKSQGPSSKKSYTRVLVSPEPSSRRWSPSTKPEEKLLFSRRSPRRSPRRYSPSYHKRERKKSSKESNSRKSKGINITLNVPQESLNSLNTKDILPRIINCSDGDVDIDTLRELRKQILGELKKTGGNDDISDLILKSYNKKRRNKKREEVEEGELSDSESEAIENIYGSLVVKEQNTPGQSKNLVDKDNRKIQICLVINSDKEQSASESVNANKSIDASDFEMYSKDEATEKVKKSEVITIDDDNEKTNNTTSNINTSIDKKHTDKELEQIISDTLNSTDNQKATDTGIETESEVQNKTNVDLPNLVEKREVTSSANSAQLELDLQKEQGTITEAQPKFSAPVMSDTKLQKILDNSDEIPPKETAPFRANFYKPIVESDNTECVETNPTETLDDTKTKSHTESSNSSAPTNSNIEDKLKIMENSIEIPLLNEPTIAQQPAKSIVSEIDILQALKNDILNESLSIPGSETATPLLHQPKVIKVASAKEILPKKRISIEKYKQKSVKPSKTYLYSLSNDSSLSSKEEQMRKSKIKLTEKECERFNIPKISFDEEESSDDDNIVKDDYSVDDIYGDLAPKSPDHDESSTIESTPPVIIPAEPVKSVTVNIKADVDMRSLPITPPPTFGKQLILPPSSDALFEIVKNDKFEQSYRPPLIDPRVRRDQRMSNESPSHAMNPEGTSRAASSTPNVLPNRTPVMTPNARSYEMTPSHQTFDVEQANRKHVYAPSFTAMESPDIEKGLPRESRPWENLDPKGDRRSRFDDPGDSNRKWDDRDPRSNSVQRDVPQKTRYNDSFIGYNMASRNDRYDKRDERPYSRAECPLTPLPSFGRSDAPIPSTQTFASLNNLPFVRGDCPTTPIHSFGRSDCPTTPIHPFGRSDCPTTPSHPFGRSDCPTTPSHPFGRTECPSTPIHPFGRSDGLQTSSQYAQDVQFGHNNVYKRLEGATTPSHSFGSPDCPQTPSHSFGRSERPMTPSHPFGMSECPNTPSHPFGRSDKITSQPFGSSEFNSKFTKDPRLNRKAEYESNSQYGEKERDYYKDRGYNRSSSYKPHTKQYGGSDSYGNFESEPSIGRGDKYQYCADKSGRHFNRDQTGYEQSRSMTRDYENDQHSREKDSRYENESSYEEVGSRRYQRERSVSRTGQPVGSHRSKSRASSIGRTEPKGPENTCSVKPDAGRSFTIDTSVNTTFQKLIESGKGIQVFDYSFDARRQRASSVGRSLVRESTVGLTLPQDFKPSNSQDNKRETFRRASSVGRDIVVSKNEKSFQEIKADFETYNSGTSQLNLSKSHKYDVETKISSEQINRNKKNLFQKEDKRSHGTSGSVYSPRKNTRDPRIVKKMNYKDPRTRREEKAANEARRKSSGIDYSSDNIAKGTILGSGCGVKNYKIPKIKRPVVEKPEEIEKEHEKLETDQKKEIVKIKKQDKINEASNDKIKEKEQVKVKETNKVVEKPKVIEKAKSTANEIKNDQVKQAVNVNVDDMLKVKGGIIDIGAESGDSMTSKSDDHVERRITRSSVKGLGELKSPESSPIKVRSKKFKKNIICDSDSDSEIVSKSNKATVKMRTSLTEKTLSPSKNKNSIKGDISLDSSFGIEDLEMFQDNAVSDPVIDNINALIADLDNDIDTTRNDAGNNFTKEITLENMFDSINSPENNDSNSADRNNLKTPETTKSVTNVRSDTLDVQFLTPGVKEKQLDNEPFSNTAAIKDVKSDTDTSCKKDIDPKYKMEEKVSAVADLPPVMSKSINEDIVSTTHIDSKLAEDISKLNEHNTDSCSTPDSTINTDENIPEKNINEDGLADSTNEVHNETNVTSTDSLESKAADELSASNKQTTATLDSIGSLLSLLQDKSKIKEVLSMLGGQSIDNERIKKKLEKLSEIMSDEEGDEIDRGTKEQPHEVSEQSSVPNIDESSNMGEESAHLQDTMEVHKTKAVVDKILDQTSEREENVNKELPIEEESKESHETIAQQDVNVSHEHIEAEESEQEPEAGDEPVEQSPKPKRRMTKKSKFAKKGKANKQPMKKLLTNLQKRVTRAGASPTIPKVKKPSRELLKLQEDIKEMFIRDDVLSSTGLRMCRIAKLVDDKNTATSENEPVVVLEKFKNMTDKKEDTPNVDKVKRKKPGPKPKVKTQDSLVVEVIKPNISLSLTKAAISSSSIQYKPGPKSKTKQKKERDPYAFETDSVDTNTEKASDDEIDSDSESSSMTSSRSFGSTECLADIKKKTKRKRGSWQTGVIKPKYKKKKVETKASDSIQNIEEEISRELVQIPDKNCFTDRTYCFRKNVLTYTCRLCSYASNDIVHHYKKQHPHIEIPLSRMAPMTAKLAIEQCTEINFQAICKIPSEKYVCIFCYKEFAKKAKSVLETFFWHIVSTHTGEYKQLCTECVQDSQCPFTLDIPSPPKDAEGQLIGYICKKCNFTQISLENIKTHVIVRHNDEQTAVYTINLSVMSKKSLNKLLRSCNAPGPARVLRSCRSNQSLTEASDDCSDITETSSRFSEAESLEQKAGEEVSLPECKPITMQSKITFETDDNASELLHSNSEEIDVPIKTEQNEAEIADEIIQNEEPQATETSEVDNESTEEQATQASDDIVDYPHFKVSFTDSGAKEYICCINRQDKHFKTTLLISMKKHVQMKHSENWDGYCYLCKVIVTAQGAHHFKDCLQHYLDKHMDSFPVLENEVVATVSPAAVEEPIPEPTNEAVESVAAVKPYINVRPLSELISKADEANFPKIERIVSLGTPTVEVPRPSPTYPPIRNEKPPTEKQFKYEEAQAQVMSNKHRIVLDTMMSRVKLIHVFKCAGRFCSFTTDLAEEALLHASTHQRIGGIDALNCSYCDFDSTGNAIDLVMHVFKTHGCCQYSCGQCFYRAAASQLVGAHMARMHTSMVNEAVLRTTTATAPVTEANMLTREQAVQYYVCAHIEQSENCKFRTYTPDKFSEHLQQRHPTATSHPCYFCSVEVPTPNELVVHMMSHGLKLYQCTWCVYGADKESELLAHVSALHPSKQPQAYLRIITNKDGSNELRVLPLAFLNKSKILTEDVLSSSTTENPVREAERSIELEKLIGHANLIAEAASQSIETNAPNDEQLPAEITQDSSNEKIQPDDFNIIPKSPPISTVAPGHVTPPRAASPHDISLQKTPVLKTEPPDTPKELPNDIVVLDSDDEDPRPGVIDLSEDDATASVGPKPTGQHIKVPLNILSRCPKCKIMCKTMQGLKRHLAACLPQVKYTLTCPHCPLVVSDRFQVFNHYMNDHRESTRTECGECGLNFPLVANAKKHLKLAHHAPHVEIIQTTKNGVTHYVIRASKQQRVQPKRKLSSGNATEAPVAKRRYLPQEIDQLPINPILDQLVYCSICEFSTKVRLNMVRHLQMHADQQPVPQTAPVNPVPHLETNEKHFDKMVNLASSSLVTRAPDKPSRSDGEPAVTLLIPPEAASRYPKYVPERQRLTCGAKGCSYISVDEQMLRIHWETLHSGASDYHCVHCPPYQHLDTSKPLTASRILAHLKMHDVTLYACSSCCYYHYKREALEKHLAEVDKTGKLMIVREEASSVPSPAATQPSAAPTMDLKPWQCGLCKFKSMLRAAVIDHCSKFHQSKMQFKCAYCPFRTSAIENINKHQTNSHPGKPEDVFYYYYREDSVADEPDGTPCWQKQRQKCGITESEIKTEVSPPPSPPPVAPTPSISAATTKTANPVPVDLNLVKKEVEETTPGSELDIGELCKRFGQFCDPNGLHFTCPLCKIVVEDGREAMQCHLYEELKYRRWGCGLCSYKAFHKNGLNDHISSEHRRQYTDPIKLPVDINMEKWVSAHLDHQKTIIDRNMVNLAKLKQAIVKNSPGPSTVRAPQPEIVTNREKYSVKDLETAFGTFGIPNDMEFCCPKCKFTTKDEGAMKDHLESELTKIRWCCSICTSHFQTYHEAQFHIKSHVGEAARPKEAVRDPAMRSAWVSTAIHTQKQTIKTVPLLPASVSSSPEKNQPDIENSLLVVRYEENVTTPEDTMPVRRKRGGPNNDAEGPSQKKGERSCQFCDFKTKYYSSLMDHVPRHFNLKPFTCGYCDFSSYRQGVVNHIEKSHPGYYPRVNYTVIPPDLIANFTKKTAEEESKLICLFCEKSIPETETESHQHDNVKPDFAKKGDVVVKCCICLVLRIDVKSLQEHHNSSHPDIPINYALFKLHHDTRETNYCGYCNKGFKYIRDLKTHHNAVHSTFQLTYTSTPYIRQGGDDTASYKRCARKSTTKLPNTQSVAKKSTTKLPDNCVGYSYYNTRPSVDEYANVTTLLPVCNTMMPFTFKKLKELLKIDPKVLVKDIKNCDERFQ